MDNKEHSQVLVAMVIMSGALLLGVILLVILLLIGFPTSLWTPRGSGDFVRGLLTFGLAICGLVVLLPVLYAAIKLVEAAPITRIEERETKVGNRVTRTRVGIKEIEDPLGGIAAIGIVVCLVFCCGLPFRYAYLLLWPGASRPAAPSEVKQALDATLPGDGAKAIETSVREIEIEVSQVRARGASKPTRITSSAGLAKALPGQPHLAEQVDFSTEQCLLFAWRGAMDDDLSVRVEESGKQPLVLFRYSRGRGDVPRQHHRLFVLPRNAAWRLVNKE